MSDPPSRSPSPYEEDVAAAMGFGSFGAKPNPPKKKRKVEGMGPDSEASGSNNTPLGVRVKGDVNAGQNLQDGTIHGGVGEGIGVSGAREGSAAASYRASDDTDNHAAGDQNPAFSANIHNPSSEMEESTSIQRVTRSNTYFNPSPQVIQLQQQGKDSNGNWDFRALKRGVQDSNGYMAFYDQRFVEDPWRHLRKQS